MKLTQRAIDTLTCPPDRKDRLTFDDVQQGLAVRVTAGGSKTYLVQYTIGGQKRRVPLGACNALSLAAAREAAQGIMGDVAKGTDVAAQRKATAAAAKLKEARDRLTLSVLVEEWARLHLAGKRPKYAAEAVRALRVAFGKCFDQPADALDRRAVVRVIDGLTAAGSVAMAVRTAAYGKACYQWAVKRGSLTDNPFTALPVASVEKRDRVLTDEELVKIWNAAGSETAFGAIVRTLVLTGQRRDEVGCMTWGEVSPDLATWTIPAARAKNGSIHLVPLSRPVADLLTAQPRRADTDLVFPGRAGAFNGYSKCKERLDAASGAKDWRLHDLRRTLATGMQRLGVRLEVTEAILNHVAGSRAGIVGVYQRHNFADEKRAALNAWADHVVQITGAKEP